MGTTTKRLPGSKLRQLMDQHGLYGNAGANVIADILGSKRNYVQAMFQRGIVRNLYRLLEFELTYNRDKWVKPERPPKKK